MTSGSTVSGCPSSGRDLRRPPALSDAEIADVVTFLRSLTDPAARSLANTVPSSAPSGLPVGD